MPVVLSGARWRTSSSRHGRVVVGVHDDDFFNDKHNASVLNNAPATNGMGANTEAVGSILLLPEEKESWHLFLSVFVFSRHC